MFELIAIAATAASGIAGFVMSKDFMRRKLRFVDAAHSPAAPFIAGAIAGVAAIPVVVLLPVVTGATALVLGAGVALGVKSAQKDRHLLP